MMPEWNLSDLYHSEEEIEKDLTLLKEEVRELRQSYQKLSLENAISFYEKIQEKLCRISSYIELLRAKDLHSQEISKLYQKINAEVAKISKSLVFFPLYINKTTENTGKYAPWAKLLRQYKPHQLSEKLEQFSIDKGLTGNEAWVRFYDETLARLRFSWDKKSVSLSEITELMASHDPKIRKEAAKSLSEGLEKEIHTFSFIYNTLIQDKRIDDDIRHFETPQSARNLHNNIDAKDVEALITAVTSRYKTLSHRYYKVKSDILQLKPFSYWDRNAPLKDEGKISWKEAKDIVLNAYRAFSPKMADIGEKFFEKGWIDAKPSPHKTSGAFSHPTVPSSHPYILMTFQGKLRDVMTLAHELGHGIHQVLAAEQGFLLSQTPLTLAETASVFGEMLTFQYLLKHYDRKYLLLSKIDDMMNTVVRQVAFYLFEKKAHAQKRELTAEELGAFWLETQKEALGDGVTLDPFIRCYWAYISHFFHTPFYVYAYAFGDCLVNSLYGQFQKNPQGFSDGFIDLLKSGGIKSYKEALAPFDLDASHSDFWSKGLDVIENMMDELEKH